MAGFIRGRSLAVSAFVLAAGAGMSVAAAQVSINMGTAPACPYGYYDDAP